MAGIKEDQFTDSTRQLLNRLQLTLLKRIALLERHLRTYKDLGNEPEQYELIQLVEDQLAKEKADLEQLRNL